MTKLEERLRKRVAQREAVLAFLSDASLSNREIGRRVGLTGSRISQIRLEEGLPRKIAPYNRKPKAGKPEVL